MHPPEEDTPDIQAWVLTIQEDTAEVIMAVVWDMVEAMAEDMVMATVVAGVAVAQVAI